MTAFIIIKLLITFYSFPGFATAFIFIFEAPVKKKSDTPNDFPSLNSTFFWARVILQPS